VKYALITPPLGERLLYTTGLNYHLALAQYLATDPDYLQMYQRIRNQCNGAFIIVDNGAAEGELQSLDDIVKSAALVDADEIVLPDMLRDSKQTIELVTSSVVLNSIPARKRFIVPQGRDLIEWMSCLGHLTAKVKFSTIGVPKHLGSMPGGRHECLRMIEAAGFHLDYNVHLLGLYDLPSKELKDIVADFPWVRGVDSGLPVALAQHGLSLVAASQRCSLDWYAGFDYDLARWNVSTMVGHCKGFKTCM